MDALHSVSVAKVAELLDLNNLTKEMNLKERAIECSDVNRPALHYETLLQSGVPHPVFS